MYPFVFLSQYLVTYSGKTNSRLLKHAGRLFHIPAGTESVLVPAFLCGLPVGAKCVYRQYQEGMIDKRTAEKMISFCSNSGPSFIFGMLSLCFPEQKMLWLIWMVQILSAFTLACCLHADCAAGNPIPAPKVVSSNAIIDSVKTIANICGWIILFRIVIAYLEQINLPLPFWELKTLLLGMLELSNGCLMIKDIESEQMRFLLCNCLLSFGGACVALQTHSICKELNIGRYIRAKLLQTLATMILSQLVVLKWWFAFPLWCTVFYCYAKRNEKKGRYSLAAAV